jgi:cell division topological specificity factor
MTISELLQLFRPPRPPTLAATAKERLQILLAHERADRHSPDFLPQLQKELLEVIKKYLAVDEDKVAFRLQRESDCSLLEVNVELPISAGASGRQPARAGA